MIDFAAVKESVQELQCEVSEGKLDQETFELRLLDMIDVADDGYYWMYGHKSHCWYRHDGQQWLLDEPARLSGFSTKVDASASDVQRAGQISTAHSEHANEPQWRSLSWGWFAASLLAIGIVAWVVYTSV